MIAIAGFSGRDALDLRKKFRAVITTSIRKLSVELLLGSLSPSQQPPPYAASPNSTLIALFAMAVSLVAGRLPLSSSPGWRTEVNCIDVPE